MLKAPWPADVVDALNRYQQAGHYHPYTCGKCRAELVATPQGWVCPADDCGYTQDWALGAPADVARED